MMGASEGDISMFNSLNLQVAWLNAGTDAEMNLHPHAVRSAYAIA
jgi:hypothetical protein